MYSGSVLNKRCVYRHLVNTTKIFRARKRKQRKRQDSKQCSSRLHQQFTMNDNNNDVSQDKMKMSTVDKHLDLTQSNENIVILHLKFH